MPDDDERVTHLSTAQLVELTQAALQSGDHALIAFLARAAVDKYVTVSDGHVSAGIRDEFQAAGGLQLDELEAAEASRAEERALTETQRLAARERVVDAANELRAGIRQVVRRELVARRGVADVARTLRAPLAEDIVIAHATGESLASVAEAIAPLGQKLTAGFELRHRRRGRIDLARSMRHALSTGGVPVELVRRKPRPQRPQLFVLADMSGQFPRSPGSRWRSSRACTVCTPECARSRSSRCRGGHG